jgi:hypothetical protein
MADVMALSRVYLSIMYACLGTHKKCSALQHHNIVAQPTKRTPP